MIQKKVCLLGAHAVGKTSLVHRSVRGTFGEAYLTTIGVRLDQLELAIDDRPVRLVLWDLHGEDRFQSVETHYLRGAHGYVLVVDPARPETIERALDLEARARATLGAVPSVLLLNKLDLLDTWVEDEAALRGRLAPRAVHATSARTGQGVREAFEALARAVCA